MPNNPHQEEEIFAAALELPTAAAQDAYLSKVCGGNMALRTRVVALLASLEKHQELFERHPAERLVRSSDLMPSTVDDSSLVKEGVTNIGRYKLLEKIGEGGFGVVFMAEQQKPVRRKVALKIIKAGMDTKQVIARFEAERQALAMMDHPNIAKVLDAGATEQGRPYFVMELVQGIPITKFCDKNRLSIKERLNLFISVCHAIQHAHQKGIIHRDIKPSNVLVTMDHGKPHPLVIDFGVAKAIDQRLTEKTVFTNFGHMIGTPAYMSPEQAEMSRTDVDTRSDVYALGILLYELLTGTTPFPEERFKEVGYAKWQQIIREEDPLRPSTVFSRLNGKSRGIADNRRSKSAALLKLLQGDLDWIVLKAIEKDRDRRYATPLELAADLRRHLRDEVVSAAAPSLLYQTMKLIRRHRIAVGAFCLILLGSGFSFWQAARATRSAAEARRQTATAQAALDFLRLHVFQEAGAQPNKKLSEVVNQAGLRLKGRYEDQPWVEAHLQDIVGSYYWILRDHPRAEAHLSRAIELYGQMVGPMDDRTLEIKLKLARVLMNESRYPEGKSLIDEVLKVRLERLGPEHPGTLKALVWLGTLHDWAGRHREGKQVLERALGMILKATPQDFELLREVYHSLAWVAASTGSGESVQLRHEAFKISRNHFGLDDPWTLHDACFRAQHLHSKLDREREALTLAQDTFQRCVRVLGEEHKTTLWARVILADLDERKGLDSLDARKEVLAGTVSALGPDNWDSLNMERRLGNFLAATGQADQGIAILTRVAEHSAEIEGLSLLTRLATLDLARAYLGAGDIERSEIVHRQLLDDSLEILDEEAPFLRKERAELAGLLARQGKWAEAVVILTESRSLGPALVAQTLILADLSDNEAAFAGLAPIILDALKSEGDHSFDSQLAAALSLCSDRVGGLASSTVEKWLGQVTARWGNESMEGLRLQALFALRNEEWRLLQDLSRRLLKSGKGSVKALGNMLAALAEHHSGNPQESVRHYQMSRGWLEQALAVGDLGPDWYELAYLYLVDRRADGLILVDQTTNLPGPEYLAKARESWVPISEALSQVQIAARAGRWSEALSQFREITRNPEFSWEAVSLREPVWIGRVATFLVMAGEDSEYQEFLHNEAVRGDSFHLHFGRADKESAQTTLRECEWKLADPSDERLKARGRHRLELLAGMAAFRLGENERAAKWLTNAFAAFNLNDSGRAAAFASMSASQLGSKREAIEWFERAEADLGALLKRNADDVGPDWQDTTALQIVLNEARTMLEEDSISGQRWQPH